MKHWALQDSKLTTETEIRDRLLSIRRQRDILCSTSDRDNHHTTFTSRQTKIAKLTEREDAMRVKLKAVLRG